VATSAEQALEQSSGRQQRLQRAVERIAGTFAAAGIPRMPARVFAFVLADDEDHYTAAELAEGLGVSPAAISGAVRYLTGQGLLFRERAAGSRADVFRINDDDLWSTIMDARLPLMGMWQSTLDEAAAEIGTDTRGGRRLAETREFWTFLQQEMTDAMQRWKQHRSSLPD
jgi:DNA-binding transcriptional ArsR family regulator